MSDQRERIWTDEEIVELLAKARAMGLVCWSAATDPIEQGWTLSELDRMVNQVQ